MSHQRTFTSNSRLSHMKTSIPDDAHHGDVLNGVGSASSLSSTASSIFSSNSQSLKHNGRSSAYSSTPRSSDSSPKPTSPYPSSKSGRPSHNGITPNMPEPSKHVATSIPSSPRDRPQVRPPPGQAKGYRAIWDPELDSKLGKEEKRKMKPKIKHFGVEVRLEIFVT